MKFHSVALSILVFGALGFANVESDNSAINKRDKKNDYALTADKQGASKADIRISSEIRKSLLSDNSLSLYAQNIKIITVNGLVTLKGPVKTLMEQKSLTDKAKNVAGVSKVVNQTDLMTK
jgi:hyperosmotically inducible protein